LQGIQKGWQTGFEPATAGTTIRRPVVPESPETASASGLRTVFRYRKNLDVRGYAAIAGVYWQKCRFLPDQGSLRFKGIAGAVVEPETTKKDG